MSDTIHLVQGDTRPALVVTLTDKDSFEPIDITGATVRLKFKAADADALTDTLVGVVLDGANGLCKFDWNANTLADAEGLYLGEIEITFEGGAVQTVYDVLRFEVRAEF